jgi:hypothetical protein
MKAAALDEGSLGPGGTDAGGLDRWRSTTLEKGVGTARQLGRRARQISASAEVETQRRRLPVNRDRCLSRRWKPKLGKASVMETQCTMESDTSDSEELEGSTGDRSKRGGMERGRPAEGIVEILQTSIGLDEKRIGE